MALPISLGGGNRPIVELGHWADGSSRDSFKLYSGNRSADGIARAMLIGVRKKRRERQPTIGELRTKGDSSTVGRAMRRACGAAAPRAHADGRQLQFRPARSMDRDRRRLFTERARASRSRPHPSSSFSPRGGLRTRGRTNSIRARFVMPPGACPLAADAGAGRALRRPYDCSAQVFSASNSTCLARTKSSPLHKRRHRS